MRKGDSSRMQRFVAGMADDCEGTDRSGAQHGNWELPSSSHDQPNTTQVKDPLYVVESLEQEDSVHEPCFNANELINMNYFAVPSECSKVDYTAGHIEAMQGATEQGKTSSRTQENAGLLAGTAASLEVDWIEPSIPVRSCMLGTSEDDDSSSRSYSGDSKEGMGDNLSREKDGDPSVASEEPYDVPMNDIPESQIETIGTVDCCARGRIRGGPPWKRWLRAWLCEARRASTFYSIALAAAVLGLVIVGSGWERLRMQYQRIRCRFLPYGKGISQAMYNLVQIKESSAGVTRIPVLKAKSRSK